MNLSRELVLIYKINLQNTFLNNLQTIWKQTFSLQERTNFIFKWLRTGHTDLSSTVVTSLSPLKHYFIHTSPSFFCFFKNKDKHLLNLRACNSPGRDQGVGKNTGVKRICKCPAYRRTFDALRINTQVLSLCHATLSATCCSWFTRYALSSTPLSMVKIMHGNSNSISRTDFHKTYTPTPFKKKKKLFQLQLQSLPLPLKNISNCSSRSVCERKLT